MKLNIIHGKIRELGAEHFKNTSGRDVFVFQSQGRIVFLHVIYGSECDSTSYEELMLTTQDLVFNSRQTWISIKKDIEEIVNPEDLSSVNPSFDACYATITDNKAFTGRLLTQDVRADLLALRALSPNIEFEKRGTTLLSRLFDRKYRPRPKNENYHYDFSFTLYGYPDNPEIMDTFVNVGLALIHATKRLDRCAAFDGFRQSAANKTQNHVDSGSDQPLTGRALQRAKAIYRSRRWSLVLGIFFCCLAGFCAFFITIYGGMDGCQRSLFWTRDFVFTEDHTPFLLFLGSFVAGLYFLLRARRGFFLADAVTSSPDYIDFDGIRNHWPHRFRDKIEEPIQLVVITIIIFLLVYCLHILFG